jgi:hypothetical protein
MPKFQSASLPYQYETEEDAVYLKNGVQRQMTWAYTVEQSATLMIGRETYPLLVEQLHRKAHYRLAEYYITCDSVDEWRYLDKSEAPYAEVMQGYRRYYDGFVLRNGVPVLQPEIAVMLGFTPSIKTIAPFIELTTEDVLMTLLQSAEYLLDNTSPLNAWKAPPIDAPVNAPSDVSSTIKQMRREVGLLTTRGRAQAIQQVMDETGVVMGEQGWTLTSEEHTRRQRLTANTAQR